MRGDVGLWRLPVDEWTESWEHTSFITAPDKLKQMHSFVFPELYPFLPQRLSNWTLGLLNNAKDGLMVCKILTVCFLVLL